ncbi:MAG: hypothetical protein IPI67_25940 [Myxococcales bacterium]|nr:hypothetical protein [Myxococcales bacterium]
MGKTDATKRRRVGATLGELRERSLEASAVLLNRAVSEAPTWVGELEARIASEPDLAGALGAYRNAYTAREGQTRRALEALRGMVDKKTPLAALPTVRTSDPRVTLVALAGELAGAGWVRG